MDVTLEEVYKAYYRCRSKKRNKLSTLLFELNYEEELYTLWKELNNKTYLISTSIAFCVTKPKLREVFAANFRDRIVHWILINKINPIIEKLLITDTYNCRKGKGTTFGVNQIYNKIKYLSNNYKEDCWIMKCDILGFFMSIDRTILYTMLSKFLKNNYKRNDLKWVLWISKKIIFHHPELLCEIRGNKQLFNNLDPKKSLFRLKGERGLPIGNLTSLIFANFYLSYFDKEMVKIFKSGYGRYVDDFICISKDKNLLLNTINKIKDYLKTNLNMTLHPNKLYIQECKKGVLFIGKVIKPNRIYIGNLTINNYIYKLKEWNELKDILKFISYNNCYLGLLRQGKSFNIRKNIICNKIKWRKSLYTNFKKLYTI